VIRPLIGVVCIREEVQFGAWKIPADFTPTTYVDAILRAGGRAVLLPLDPGDVDDPAAALEALDALIIPGGVDLEPATYGHEPHPELGATSPLLDAVELALTRAAMQADLPLLGVCRGMQVLNVATGGTLHQHLPDLLSGSEEHRRVLGTLDERNAHDVDLVPGSLAAAANGTHVAVTRSHHHQAIDEIGAELVVTGRADDGLAEAIEHPNLQFCLGVQWHPEADPESSVIEALVEAARGYRATRAGERSVSR
jgi:putative glutamine amidotransferase